MTCKSSPPSIKETAFDCPHCDTVSAQYLYVLIENIINVKNRLYLQISLIIALGFLSAPSIACAEIEKIVVFCEEEMCFYWWPKLPHVEGWHQDRKNCFLFKANTLAPDGSTFANAETVMYAKAIYKPRRHEIKSIEMLIEDDKKGFVDDYPGILIEEISPLISADGKKLRTFTFFPTDKGNWESVSYGEEGDYFIIFTFSSRSLSGYNKAITVFEKLIADYKE